MRQPFFRRSQPLSREHGVTMVLVALAMVAIIAMAAISIDVITLYLAREEAQRSADSAALAAMRVISLSGITGDPNNVTGAWQKICGAGGPATQAATAVALQNVVGGTAADTVTVTYSVAGGSTGADCSKLGSAFAINPIVTVQIQRTGLPNFFSRIWGRSGNNISASSTAEAFTSSNSGSIVGTIVPVQPSCVKPWIVPNHDPLNPSGGAWCDQGGGPCQSLVSTADGSITNPGIQGTSSPGIIGETFSLVSDCVYDQQPNCQLRDIFPKANHARTQHIVDPPNLEYLPGQVLNNAAAVPSCGTTGSGGSPDYETAVAGCDQSTVYQCGMQSSSSPSPNMVDLSENPAGSGDTENGVQCLIHEGNPNAVQPDGQDTLNSTLYPFQILAGSGNPLVLMPSGLSQGTPITSSTSVVSLPIYDDQNMTHVIGPNTTPVTIIGFLQVFINNVDRYGNVNITVLNVVGCSNGQGTYTVGTNPVTGTSPVPTRLATHP